MSKEIKEYHTQWLTYANRMKSMLSPHIDKLDYSEGTALDWGCSFGVSTKEIAVLFDGKLDLVGMDISIDRLLGSDHNKKLMESIRPDELNELLDKYFLVSYVAGDGYQPPFANNSFEIIFMMNNLTELLNKGKLSKEDLVTVLERNFQLLKDEGTLVIGTNTGIGNLLLLIKKQVNGNLRLECLIDYEKNLEKDYPLQYKMISNHHEYQFICDQVTTAIKLLNQQ